MSGIGFNYIPGTGLTAPIFTFEVNSGGQFQDSTRLILIGHKTSAGTMALNTPTPVASQNDVDTFAGGGSMLREMFRVATANAPAQPIWIEAVADVGVAPVWTVTIASPTAGVGTFDVNGQRIQIPISG